MLSSTLTRLPSRSVLQMKITNDRAYASYEIMLSLKESGKLGFAIAKNVRKLESELTEFIEKRKELFLKYGSNNNDGTIVIATNKIKDFLNEFDSYASMEFEFQPQLVDQETFCSGSLTSDQMYVLDWMVKE